MITVHTARGLLAWRSWSVMVVGSGVLVLVIKLARGVMSCLELWNGGREVRERRVSDCMSMLMGPAGSLGRES
jgi:hypothetical protein